MARDPGQLSEDASLPRVCLAWAADFSVRALEPRLFWVSVPGLVLRLQHEPLSLCHFFHSYLCSLFLHGNSGCLTTYSLNGRRT